MNTPLRQLPLAALALFAALPSCLADPADTANTDRVPEANAPSGGSKLPLIFERVMEPNEKAFSYLRPKGWQSEGGMFNVNPLQAGGPGNALEPKCDLKVGRTAAGKVYFRWLPTWNYADFSRNPQAALTAGMFREGANYQGMKVRRMPDWETFLRGLLKQLHPSARAVKVIERLDLPEVAMIFRDVLRSPNQQLRMLGLPPITIQAGALLLEYREDGKRYRQALATALVDNRGAALMWSNAFTLAMRAPSDEADRWKPVFDVIRQSVRFDPNWLARAVAAAGERGGILRETMNHMQRLDQEIGEHRARTHANTQYEGHLLLTGQEDYVNPFNGKVETDINDYPRRWTNEHGDRIYTEDREYDPNKVTELNHVEWKLTPVRKR